MKIDSDEMQAEMLERAADAHFHEELTQFVGSLPVESADSNQRYDAKLAFMNSIHGEVKQQHPKWRPEHTESDKMEAVTIPKGKYSEVIYSIHPQRD
jgi:hypothetical protein